MLVNNVLFFVYKMNMRGSIKQRWRVTEMSALKIRTLNNRRVRKVVCIWGLSRENWIIYRGTGFLRDRMILPLPHSLLPLSRQQVFSLSQSSYVLPVELNSGWRGRGRSQIIRPRESLVLHNSFKTIWVFCMVDREGVGNRMLNPHTPFSIYSISCSKVKWWPLLAVFPSCPVLQIPTILNHWCVLGMGWSCSTWGWSPWSLVRKNLIFFYYYLLLYFITWSIIFKNHQG